VAGVQEAEHREYDDKQHKPYDESLKPIHDLSYRSIDRIIISHKTPPLRWDINEGETTWGGTDQHRRRGTQGRRVYVVVSV